MNLSDVILGALPYDYQVYVLGIASGGRKM